MKTNQPTLAQLNAASKADNKAYNNFNNTDFSTKTQKQYDAAKAKMKKTSNKYWEMVESVTEENPQYDVINHNGHYDC